MSKNSPEICTTNKNVRKISEILTKFWLKIKISKKSREILTQNQNVKKFSEIMINNQNYKYLSRNFDWKLKHQEKPTDI